MWKLVSIIVLVIHSGLGIPRMTPRESLIVDTKLGQIKGLRSENGNIAMFLGVPYAVVDETSPLAPSVPHGGFEEVFNADNGSILCPQMISAFEPIGQVQCLNLNIYVPNEADSQNPLPVMVYIHGGAFILGSGSYVGVPRHLVEKGVIVVTVNYRVGIYGFICTDSPKAPGNIGLRDQVLGLRWIKDNIGDFGGDANQVTVFGDSAGAMSVHFHLLSSYEVLYNKAILQSGAATSPWTVVNLDNNVALRLAELLGLDTQDVDEALDFISRADVLEATLAGNQLRSTSQYSFEPLTKPCVEKEFEGFERFVPLNPNVATTDKVRAIPIMMGFGSQELIFQHADQPDDFFNNYSFIDTLEFGFDVNNFDDMIKTVRQFYIGDEPTSKNLENEITNFASDFLFSHPVDRTIDLFLKSGAEKIYHYVFSYVGNRSATTISNSTLVGASHVDDMNYLFDTISLENHEVVTPEDQLIIDRMTTMWTNFAKYGDPIPQTSDLLPVKWETVSQDTRYYLNIDSEMTMQLRPFHDRFAFWNLFYETNDQYTMWNSNNN